MIPISGMKQTNTQRFFIIFYPVSVPVRSSFESRENTTMSTTILWPEICISKIIDKPGMCWENIKQITSQTVSAVHL